MTGQRPTRAQLEEAWADQSLSTEDMAERWGVTSRTVSTWAKAAGLPKRRAGRKPGRNTASALSGGRWVARGGVQVWVREGAR